MSHFARATALAAALFAAVAVAHSADAPKTTAPAPKPAEKPADQPAPQPKDAGLKVEGETVKMPVFAVSAQRLREIDVTIKKLEKEIKSEKKLLERSNLDDTLNSEKVSKAAAIFGGKSNVQRASVAAVRVESMEKELQLLETLRTPLTKSDRELIEQLVKDQRAYRRSLDEALR